MLVDTGATISMIPRRILRQLGIEPHRRVSFSLANQAPLTLDVGSARIQINGSYDNLAVAFGPDDAEPLLGATALETFGLAADPVNGRLIYVGFKLK
jgi:clan AA aspartic protease